MAEYAALWEEAHFRADAELRGKWVLKGTPALVDSNSPRYGEKASYYSAVCLETGEVEWMELEGNSNSGTSVAFLTQLKEKHPGPLRVIWDNAPAHRGEATGNLCLGSRAAVQERAGKFLAGLSSRKDEVRQRCRTVLQSRAETLPRDFQPDSPPQANAHPTLALV